MCICFLPLLQEYRLYYMYVVSYISEIFGEFVFSSDFLDFDECSFIMKVYVNIGNKFPV